MEVTITTKFDQGDRVWMPVDGKLVKGKVVEIRLGWAELTKRPQRISWESLSYECIDEQMQKHIYHEWQLKPRELQ